MTPETFFENFAYLADAPNGVQKLRELILQLAIRGKLVSQDSTDEPAAKLLERIRAEKVRLVKDKKIRKADPLLPVTAKEAPYELPQGWVWGRAQDVMLSITDGDHLPPPKTTNGIPLLVIGNVRSGSLDFSETRFVSTKYFEAVDESRKPRKGDLLFTLVGSYGIPVLISSEVEFCVQRHIGIMKPSRLIDSRFLTYLYGSSFIFDQATRCATGIAQKTVPLSGLRKFLLPLPPLAEQQRIVTKIVQIMTLCNEFEARQQKSQKRLLRLNNSALHGLTSAIGANKFTTAWQFVCDNFNILYSTPETIANLRQSILQLAVQGRLVPQDPTDEHAAKLLARIRAEKARLVKEKKIRKTEPLPPVGADEAPYELPNGWEWTYLSEISDQVHYGYTASADHNFKDVRMLRITDIQNNKVNWQTVPGCQIAPESVESYVLKSGDLLIARTGGTIGKTYLVEDINVCSVFASYLIRVVPNRHSLPKYIKLFAESPLYWHQLYEKSMGTGQPNVNGVSLSSLILPFPPLVEQQRIVVKVNQLMALCDGLEARLTKAQTKAEKLTVAAVHRLLAA